MEEVNKQEGMHIEWIKFFKEVEEAAAETKNEVFIFRCSITNPLKARVMDWGEYEDLKDIYLGEWSYLDQVKNLKSVDIGDFLFTGFYNQDSTCTVLPKSRQDKYFLRAFYNELMILNEVMVREHTRTFPTPNKANSQRMIDNLILAVQHITNREKEVRSDKERQHITTC